MAIGIEPTVDYAFKRLFGSPAHTSITIHFLNAVLTDAAPIQEVELLNPMIPTQSTDDKLPILDVRARDNHGRWLNIEMQTSLPAMLAERLTFYVCHLYSGQLIKGDHYTQLAPAISICVLNRILFREVDALHLNFRLCDANQGVRLTDDLQIHVIELPKYNIQHAADAAVLAQASALTKWVYFLRNAAGLTARQLSDTLADPEFSEAAGVLEMISRTPQEREHYEARLKFERDEAARLLAARLEGEEIGEARGEARGEDIGKIRLLQHLLGVAQSPHEDLRKLDVDRLRHMVEELQTRLQNRR